LFVDELDIALLAKSGYQWMPKGTQTEIVTPGKNEKAHPAHYPSNFASSG
jgi:hypothetical protein